MPCTNWKCCQITSNKIKTFKQKKKIFKLINKNRERYGFIKFDECDEYKKIGKRCDFIIVHNLFILFLELKGRHFEDAIKQIKNSIKNTEKNHRGKLFAIIVSNNSPSISTKIQKIQKEFKRKGVEILYRTNKLSKKIENFY